MKNYTLIILLVLFTLAGNAQNQKNEYPELVTMNEFNFSIHTGISSTNHERINTTYGIESFFSYGVGFRYGTPEQNKFIPFYEYDRTVYTSYYRLEGDKKEAEDEQTQIKLNEHTFGAYFTLFSKNKNSIMLVNGLNLGNQKERSIELDRFYYGYKLGVHYENKVLKGLKYFVALNYNINFAEKKNRNVEGNSDPIPSNLQNIKWMKVQFGLIF